MVNGSGVVGGAWGDDPRVVEYRHGVAELPRRWGRKEWTGVADQLERIAGLCRGDWDGRGAEAVAFLDGLDAGGRALLVEYLVGRADLAAGRDRGLAASLLALVTTASRGLPVAAFDRWRAPRLAEFERSFTARDADRLATSARLELAAGRPLSPALVAVIRRTGYESWQRDALAGLLGSLAGPPVDPGEPWADRVLAFLETAETAGPEWSALCAHAATATAARPTAAWQRTARRLLEPLDPAEVRAELCAWLAPAGLPRPEPLLSSWGQPVDPLQWDPYNADALRGLAWLLGLLPGDRASARALAGLCEAAVRKLPGSGPRSPKVANAAVHALSQLSGPDGVGQLARLAARVTYRGALKPINAALDARARAEGLSREEVEELSVPTFDLAEVGFLVVPFGAGPEEEPVAAATLEVVGTGVRWSWRTAAGKTVKAAPQSVRVDHAEELKALRASVKDMEKTLVAQSARLERQFVGRRVWEASAWRERFLDHPLVGTLARRLVWTVDDTACCWADGALRRLDGSEVDLPSPSLSPSPSAESGGSRVELWHPAAVAETEAAAWRDRLDRLGIEQPFAQVLREVHRFASGTGGEVRADERFAGRVLWQHRFHAVALQRGWIDRLRLAVDAEFPPAVRELPAWALRAEFWVDGDTEPLEGSSTPGGGLAPDIVGAGSYLRLRTGRLRFYPIDAPPSVCQAGSGNRYRQRPERGAAWVDPLPLSSVPPLVLSEVLCDVGLFVGTAAADRSGSAGDEG